MSTTVTHTITERDRPAPVEVVYPRTIDGVDATITIPEPQAIMVSTSTNTEVFTDN